MLSKKLRKLSSKWLNSGNALVHYIYTVYQKYVHLFIFQITLSKINRF